MLSGILFDLDGTLLDIDIDAFLGDYFGALGPVVADVLDAGMPQELGLRAVLEGTAAMTVPHPGQTNQVVFNARFKEMTGVNLDLEEYSLPFERFYAQVFPTLRGAIRPRPGARQAVRTALDLGLRVAIATNPIFPLSAIRERMRWADVADLEVHAVTAYECMHATKPLPAYFRETAAMMGASVPECLMVGDDRSLDMPAADIGMRTFYVGCDPHAVSTYSGTLGDLTALLPRLVAGRS